MASSAADTGAKFPDYSHPLKDFQDILAEAGKRGFEPNGFDCFVETGTFLGQTVIPLAHHFREVHTIEVKAECFEAAKLFSWKAKAPVHFHYGQSTEVLGAVVCRLKRKTIFYLDAHYSGGVSGGAELDVPLFRELDTIRRYYRGFPGVVVIDDLELFGRAHKFDGVVTDWTWIHEQSIRDCFAPERIVCSFTKHNCFVLCLRPLPAPPEPPAGKGFLEAKGGSSTCQAHWVSEPGRPLDQEALEALRARGSGWNDVANLISMEYHKGATAWSQRSGKEESRLVPKSAALPRRRKPKITITREEAMNMEQELVSRFEEPALQAQLRKAWAAAEGDLERQMRARMEVLLPVQAEVIAKYGFEPTRQGVAQSVHTVRALFLDDNELMSLAGYLSQLVDPTND